MDEEDRKGEDIADYVRLNSAWTGEASGESEVRHRLDAHLRKPA